MSVIARTTNKLLMTNHDYVTGIETCEFSYELTIINIIQWTRKKIKSPSFSSGYSDFNDEWILEIYPSNTDLTMPAWILVDLQPQSSNTPQLLKTKYLLDPLNGYLLNGELKICCTIKMSRKLTNDSDVTSKFTATQQLSGDLEKLLLNEKSADVTIQVGQKSFRAIKGILGARSPVFAAINLKNNSDVTPKFMGTQQLSADLEKLLFDEKSADVTIQVGKKSFRAIKGILGARSPVFAAISPLIVSFSLFSHSRQPMVITS
ncbi:uncharacterized protein LOC122853927 [Aphidius gifuensis]|uniref:uncharacterized protein LOC122853927 n=1 Tax=Aphidius gifuensis TaxID=684658 RepID=UPI001CDD10A3|nr:uncharacterized protein LOC122853927 [Aphidius gifuensis]